MSSDGDQKCPQCLATVRGGEFCSNCGGPLPDAPPSRPRVAFESGWALLGKLLVGALLVIIALIVIGTVCAETDAEAVSTPPAPASESPLGPTPKK